MSQSVLETSQIWSISINSILYRRDALNNVLNTRSYHSAVCDTDHSLICARVRMQPTSPLMDGGNSSSGHAIR